MKHEKLERELFDYLGKLKEDSLRDFMMHAGIEFWRAILSNMGYEDFTMSDTEIMNSVKLFISATRK